MGGHRRAKKKSSIAHPRELIALPWIRGLASGYRPTLLDLHLLNQTHLPNSLPY